MIDLFSNYENRKHDLLAQLIPLLHPIYTLKELEALRIEPIAQESLSIHSGYGFVNREILETVLGNLLECVAPGSHNASPHQQQDLSNCMSEVSDQLYAMISQSFLAVKDSHRLSESDIIDLAIEITFDILSDLPRLKSRAFWNRFASLKDPAVWDAYLLSLCADHAKIKEIDLSARINTAILERNHRLYQDFLEAHELAFALDYQMQLVVSTYPGWRVLFYHDVAHQLVQGKVGFIPVPLLPRAISELAGRYYQADLHPETRIGDANFFDHTHRGITTGQTGIIGSGCVIYPCTLGGLSEKVHQRHPSIGNYAQISTDVGIFGPVKVGNYSIIGANTELYGFVETGQYCRIGSSVVIGTVRMAEMVPGRIILGDHVRIADGTVIENNLSTDLIIGDSTQIPARSYIINDGKGNPKLA